MVKPVISALTISQRNASAKLGYEAIAHMATTVQLDDEIVVRGSGCLQKCLGTLRLIGNFRNAGIAWKFKQSVNERPTIDKVGSPREANERDFRRWKVLPQRPQGGSCAQKIAQIERPINGDLADGLRLREVEKWLLHHVWHT
jgi:hypothetical protein